MTDTLLDRLRHTRPGYDAECRWHRFLVDAYTGCGGFDTGDITQPLTSYWGPGAEVYAASGIYSAALKSTVGRGSYLDQFHREDGPKYEGRKRIATYLNYVEPLTELKCSYMLRKPFNRPSEPQPISDWRADTDGAGTSWDDVRPLVAANAAILGWTPLLLDRPNTDGVASKAQAQVAGIDHWITKQLAPANVLDYEEHDGRFRWVMVKTSRCERLGWGDKPTQIDEYSIWDSEKVTRYEARHQESGDPIISAPVEMRHPFGRVPLVIFRHKRRPGKATCLAGLPMHGQIAKLSRRLFNLSSEFDEHIRGQVFALLVTVGSIGSTNEKGEVVVGTSNGIPLDPEAKQIHYYLAPPASVAATLEKRLIATITEIYRMAQVEFTRPAGGVTSAESRAYEFAQTNRAIADYAAEFARAETELSQLVGKASSVSDEMLRTYAVSAPNDFDVENLTTELKAATDAVSLNLGPTANGQLKLRVVERMLPNVSPEMKKKIAAEIETMENAPPPVPVIAGPAPTPPAPPIQQAA